MRHNRTACPFSPAVGIARPSASGAAQGRCAPSERAEIAARLQREAELAHPRECAECGAPFMPSQVTARFCSSP
jgi:hypothetical protein